MKDQVILPLLADIEAARIKAQTAYTKWMDYMTGIVWRSDFPFSLSLSFPLLRQSKAYFM